MRAIDCRSLPVDALLNCSQLLLHAAAAAADDDAKLDRSLASSLSSGIMDTFAQNLAEILENFRLRYTINIQYRYDTV